MDVRSGFTARCVPREGERIVPLSGAREIGEKRRFAWRRRARTRRCVRACVHACRRSHKALESRKSESPISLGREMDGIARLSRGFEICESRRRAIHRGGRGGEGPGSRESRDPPVRGNARLAKARPNAERSTNTVLSSSPLPLDFSAHRSAHRVVADRLNEIYAVPPT